MTEKITHIEVTMPSTVQEGHNTTYSFSNWKEATDFVRLMAPEWANCKRVED